ncbi:hypothetical protein INR49_028934, partial [Caranx melampygus]
SFHFSTQLPKKLENGGADKRKRKKLSEEEEDEDEEEEEEEEQVTSTKKKRKQKSKSVCEDEELQPGPSSQLTPASPLKRGEQSDPWNWPLYKSQLPVTCGRKEGSLSRSRLAKGEEEAEDGENDLGNQEDQVPSSDEEDCSDEDRDTEEQSDSVQTNAVFKVTCGDVTATLHQKRFVSGTCGKSIRTETKWLNPVEFVKAALDQPDATWKKDIMVEGRPLNALIEEEILKIHSLLCSCRLCHPSDTDLENERNDDECHTCRGEEEQAELVQCDDCPRSFHQKCHLPHECQYLLLFLRNADEKQDFVSNPCAYLENYSSVIQTPMWLDKVADKLQENEYNTVGEFVSDMQLIFTNCASYNHNNPEFLDLGDQLKETAAVMGPLDWMEPKKLQQFFRRNKTAMSCMENPHNFLRHLRDHDLIPEDQYQETIINQCPTLRLLRNSFMDGEKCILFEKQWFTPGQFEKLAGKGSSKNWKLSIRCMGTTLGKLIKAKRFLLSADVIVIGEDEEEDEDDEDDLGNQEDQVPSSDEEDCAGTCGKSIRTETKWLSPVEFVKAALDQPDATWKKDIMVEGRPLNALIEENDRNDDDCYVCKGEEEEEEAELVQCDDCPRSFHQKCHLPHVDDATLSDSRPWECTFCVLQKAQEWRYNDEMEMNAVMSRHISGHMLECQYLLLFLRNADEKQDFVSNPCAYLENYSSVIQTPMWLDKVADKLQEKEYNTVGEFVSDMQLIFTNCASYNHVSQLLWKTSGFSTSKYQELRNLCSDKVSDVTLFCRIILNSLT